MYTPFRIIAEKSVILKENLEEKIAKLKGEYTLRVPILMYHHIGIPPVNEKNTQLYVHPDLFKQEMEYLEKNKFNVVSLDDLVYALLNKKELPQKSVVITFDDGNLNFFNCAFPVLKRYRIKATVFVVTSWINRSLYLTENMINIITKSSLVSIGSHTINHHNLIKLHPTKVTYELVSSKKYLEKKFGMKVSSLAYPFGGVNKTIIQEIQKSGYKNASTIKYGNLHVENKLFELKRIRLGSKLTISDFIGRI